MKFQNNIKIKKIFTKISNDSNVKDLLDELKEHNLESYYHSLRVCYLCLDIGISKKYPLNDLYILGLSGLLHNIGILIVPQKILQKKSTQLKKKEKKYFKIAPRYGYMLLNEIGFNIEKKIVVAYSEYQKISNFPRVNKDRREVKRIDSVERRENNMKVSSFSQIVAIADIFEKTIKKNTNLDKNKMWSSLNEEFLGNKKEYINDLLLRV